MDNDDDRDGAILEQRIAGKSVVALAEQYRCATSHVDAIIDRRLSFDLTNDQRLKAVKLDCARIEALMLPFFERATKDRDVSAGTLCCKLLERRALLLGLDHPTQSRVDVYQVGTAEAAVPAADRSRNQCVLGPHVASRQGLTRAPSGDQC